MKNISTHSYPSIVHEVFSEDMQLVRSIVKKSKSAKSESIHRAVELPSFKFGNGGLPVANSTLDAVGTPAILSFFTGAGFLDIGFHESGFETIWHNEFMPPFVDGFEHGMSTLGLEGCQAIIQNTNSILDVGPKQILKEAFGSAGVSRPFGIIGGPPCPDFSVGGKNRGSDGERGQLSSVYIQRIKELKPDFFLFENVPGLIRTAKHRSYLESLVAELSGSFLLDLKILRALDFGVPQDRERLFMVGISMDFLRKQNCGRSRNISASELVAHARNGEIGLRPNPAFHWFPWYEYRMYPSAKHSYPWPETHTFQSRKPPLKPTGCPEALMVGPAISGCKGLPNSEDCFVPYSSVFTQIDEGDVSRKSSKRLHRWRYSPAAAYGNNEVHLHPFLPRRLNVREAMRIQTVPDGYVLPADMTLTAKFKTIGNGVPVTLAKCIASSMRLALNAVYEQNLRFNP